MTAGEKRTLKQFAAYKIPKQYFELDALGGYTCNGQSYDLMYCYEDLSHYTWCALHKQPIDPDHNFVNVPSQGLTQGFAECLRCIGKEYNDIMEFCAMCISPLDILWDHRSVYT